MNVEKQNDMNVENRNPGASVKDSFGFLASRSSLDFYG
jgi:hypothetical protein